MEKKCGRYYDDDAAGVDHYDEDCVNWSAVKGEAGYVNTVIEPS